MLRDKAVLNASIQNYPKQIPPTASNASTYAIIYSLTMSYYVLLLVETPSTKAYWHSPNSSASTHKGSDLLNSKYPSRTSSHTQLLQTWGNGWIERSFANVKYTKHAKGTKMYKANLRCEAFSETMPDHAWCMVHIRGLKYEIWPHMVMSCDHTLCFVSTCLKQVAGCCWLRLAWNYMKLQGVTFILMIMFQLLRWVARRIQAR